MELVFHVTDMGISEKVLWSRSAQPLRTLHLTHQHTNENAHRPIPLRHPLLPQGPPVNLSAFPLLSSPGHLLSFSRLSNAISQSRRKSLLSIKDRGLPGWKPFHCSMALRTKAKVLSP